VANVLNYWRVMSRRGVFLAGFALGAALFGGGCVKAPPQKPVVQTPPPPAPHIQGVWEYTDRSGKTRKMVFAENGQVTFQGGLEFFNPGRWDLDPMRQELKLTFPNADDDKLQIFKLYVGDGVKSFDRVGKVVVYHFDDDTYSLNIGGWMYAKTAEGQVGTVAEPQLK
jgi:hypothetical protein